MNIEFLKKLKQKLQVGNTRSIHLNSYPGRLASRLDIFELSYISKNLPADFINKLLGSPNFNFKFKIEAVDPEFASVKNEENPGQGMPAPEHAGLEVHSPHHADKDTIMRQNLISKRLSSVYYENEDTYLEHGVKTFGFGYPTLLYRTKNDPSRIINAPVFIWMLDLKRDKNEWIISRDEEHSISINDVLLNYLEGDMGTSGFSKLNEEYLSDSLLDKNEFIEIINRLLQQISSNAIKFDVPLQIEQMLDKQKRSEYVKKIGSPVVYNSGVFGLFKTPKEPLIKDIKTLIDKSGELKYDKLQIDPYQKVKFSAIDTDPAQQRALINLGISSRLIIHGPPGTGKSQTLTAIITNALFNKAKCLVVCEKRTALEVILKNLTGLGLGSLCGLIEDVNRDRRKIVDAVRDHKPQVNPVNRSILNNIFTETNEAISVVNNNHVFYGNNLLNDMSWGDLVGLLLKNSDDDKNYLKLYRNLKSLQIDFTAENISEKYNTALNNVSKNSKLFKAAEAELDIFKILNDDLFKSRSARDIVLELAGEIKKLHADINSTLVKLNTVHSDYAACLDKYYDTYYNDLHRNIDNISVLYRENSLVNKNLFTELNGWVNFKLSVLSLFSKKYKKLKTDKKDILPLFYEMREFCKQNYFEFKITDIQQSLTEIEPQIDTLSAKLKSWYDNIEEYRVSKLGNYSSSEFDQFAYDKSENLQEAEKSAENILSIINNSRLFSEAFYFEDPSIKQKIDKLSAISGKLELISKDINSLYDYFYWRCDYFGCSEISKKIIDEFIDLKINHEKWEADTEQFFIFNILVANENSIKLRDDSLLDEISGNLNKIKEYQSALILEYWQKRQEGSAAEFEKRTGISINALYNKSRNSKYQKRNSLRKIIAADHEVFTDHFPVMLVNPVVCSSLFEMSEGLFDIVIFDEASQLRVEDVYAAKLRGKHRVVSGDENQMPPSNYFASSQIVIDSDNMNEEEDEVILTTDPRNLADSESLLEFAIRRGYSQSFLDIHYRSKHPDLIEFSNAAFYGSRLSPMPPANNYKAMRYFNVCGIYNQADGINKQEAEKVISLINELIIPEKGENNPSIGVATFNIFQRNYILDMINYAANNNSDFAQKLGIIMNNPSEPFFVKNLENIQGDERDIIIISTTFGKRADGSFLQNFGPVNQEKGFRLLNVIITRAKHMMIVCTSIPDEYIREFPSLIAQSGNKGKGIFYAYLAYAKAIEEYDLKSKNSVLALISAETEKSSGKSKINRGTGFEDEVYRNLSLLVPPERLIKNYSTGGFMVDIAVLPAERSGSIIAIECDGSSEHFSDEAYAWDIFRGKYLQKFGMKFIRIWSVNWWNNSERELKRLMEFIEQAN